MTIRKQGFVALLDVLGFSERVQRDPEAGGLDEYIDTVVDVTRPYNDLATVLFVEFDRARLDTWLAQTPAILERIGHLNRMYNTRRVAQGQNPRSIIPKFILLHTFAHIMINQLAYECGYGSASLRERLYCADDNFNEPMYGVLIYTASGDSEGSMGGLVRQGAQGTFENIVERAIQRARWCSSDPVCIESQGQGAENCNLSACHSCCLVPETSCEEGNRLLDRALLVGKPGEPEIGFFSPPPASS